MKKLFAILLCSVFAFTGCTPDEAKILKTTKASAKAAALVIKLTKMDAETQTNIVYVLETVKSIVPGDGKTCVDVWTPVIKNTIADLLAKGKIHDVQADIIETAAIIAASGVDYIIKKYSNIGEDLTLASKVVATFVDTLKDALSIDGVEKGDYDNEAYEYLLNLQRNLKK